MLPCSLTGKYGMHSFTNTHIQVSLNAGNMSHSKSSHFPFPVAAHSGVFDAESIYGRGSFGWPNRQEDTHSLTHSSQQTSHTRLYCKYMHSNPHSLIPLGTRDEVQILPGYAEPTPVPAPGVCVDPGRSVVRFGAR